MQTSTKQVLNDGEYLLSVVIINYRTPGLIQDCISTLLPELENIHSVVQIVDNFSNDGSTELIKKWLDDLDTDQTINLIASSTNSGFSGGNNLGISAARAKYYLLLNSDTLVRKDSISLLITEAERNPRVGLISPRLEWPDGTPQKSCFNYHSPITEFLMSARTSLLSNLLKSHNIAHPVSNLRSNPQWTSFACVLVRHEVIEDIGLMDDGYFMYYEDSDFCYHARKSNWEILNAPESHIVHLRGGSSPVKENTIHKKRLPKYYYASRTRYFYKLYGRSGLILANVLWLAGRSISLLRETLGNKQPHVCEKAWLDIWTNFLNPLDPFQLK
jgi:N-acetylglucosaminyl-diphospho-decaprenol L-rhamnosyltransferase